MRVYVDCDDVVAETARHLIDLRRRGGGWAPEFGQMFDFDLHRSLRLGDEEYRVFMEKAHEPEELAALEEVPGACETLRAWRTDGIEPFIVTGRPACAHAATLEWLERRGLAGIPLLMVDKYNRRLGAETAGVEVVPFASLSSFGFDLAVDDAPQALDLLAASGFCPFVVFDRPWNRTYNPDVPRVPDWRGLDAYVRGRA